ncbi:MAG: hypothetical protein WD847_00775 [Pirellulales bacterium]
MATLVYAVTRPELAPFTMSDRFRTEIAYFMSIPGEDGIPSLPEGEYWIRCDSARIWLDEGVMHVVSPLDSENQAQVELSEEHENWLQWMVDNGVQHVRIVRTR